MATTALQVFDLAMRLMGNTDASGNTDTTANAEYKRRALGILNILCTECYPFSDAYSASNAGVRPVLSLLTAFADVLGPDDGICRSVLPYGLAAHLLLDEDAAKASFFNNRYEQLKNELKAVPGEFAQIENVYGGTEHNEFSAW